jgi:hypothetical protein
MAVPPAPRGCSTLPSLPPPEVKYNTQKREGIPLQSPAWPVSCHQHVGASELSIGFDVAFGLRGVDYCVRRLPEGGACRWVRIYVDGTNPRTGALRVEAKTGRHHVVGVSAASELRRGGNFASVGTPAHRFLEGSPVVGIRPEEVILIRPDRPPDTPRQRNLLLGIVAAWVDLGHYRLARLRVSGLELGSWLNIRAAREYPMEAGTEVRFHIRPWSFCLLPPER